MKVVKLWVILEEVSPVLVPSTNVKVVKMWVILEEVSVVLVPSTNAISQSHIQLLFCHQDRHRLVPIKKV